jgi:hypothetical protein
MVHAALPARPHSQYGCLAFAVRFPGTEQEQKHKTAFRNRVKKLAPIVDGSGLKSAFKDVKAFYYREDDEKWQTPLGLNGPSCSAIHGDYVTALLASELDEQHADDFQRAWNDRHEDARYAE